MTQSATAQCNGRGWARWILGDSTEAHLARRVQAAEGRPEVHEDGAAQTAHVGADEGYGRRLRTAVGIRLLCQLERHVDGHDHGVLAEFLREGALNGANLHPWVEFLHLLKARGRAIFADVVLAEVKVGATVRGRHRIGVVQSDCTHIGQDDILGDFGTQPVEAGDEHRGFAQHLH